MRRAAKGRFLVHLTWSDMTLWVVLSRQLEAYKRAGWRVLGVSAPGPYVEQLQDAGIDHLALRRATRAFSPPEDARAVAELVSVFRRLRPDVVHTHTPKAGIYGRVAARLAGVPVVVNTVHGLYAQPQDRLAKRAAVYGGEVFASWFSDAELVLNSEDAAVLTRVGVRRDKITVLGSGVDLAHFDPSRFDAAQRAKARRELGVGPDDVVIGVVGRLVYEKGYKEVFEAARLLRSQAPNARFVCAGPEEPSKADRVTPGDLAEAARHGVQWLGARADMARLYSAFDMYVLASYREGFPMAAMEACAMGLPVIASDISGCRRVVDHGQTGLIVPLRDSGALARAIAALVADPARRAAMGAAGRQKALREFDESAVVRQTLAVYERLVDGSPSATA